MPDHRPIAAAHGLFLLCWCLSGAGAALANISPDATDRPAIPMQRNMHDVFTVEVTVGRSLLFSGNPNADPVPFIVDTGANRTAVPRLIASQLIEDAQITLDQIGHAVTGTFDTGLFFVDQLDFGLGPREVEVAVFEEHYGSVMNAAGILGSNAFRDEVITLDYPSLQIRLEQGPPAAETMALRIENGLIVGEGRVRRLDQPVRVFVDTGANASIANSALLFAHRSGSAGGNITIEGVSGGTTAPGSARRIFSGLQISDLCVGPFTITVSDVYFFERIGWTDEPALILGMDVLQHSRITIDYANNTARVEGTQEWACRS